MSKRLFILLLLALYPRAVSAGINLALHKSYTISPKLNYRLCTDEGDKLQLTDGKSYGSNWGRKSTVGWGGMVTTPEITIDLEKKSYIDEVMVHSIGGGTAEVEYPTFIAVLISEDGENFGFVSLIGSDDLPKGRYGSAGRIAHIFAAKNIGVEGRFVKVLMEPGGRYLFLDEIEVVGSRRALAAETIRPQKLEQFTDSFKVVSTLKKQLRLKGKITATAEAVRQYRGKVGVDFCEGILSELEQLADDFVWSRGELFPVEKLLGFSKRLGAIRARIYSEIYKKPYACVPANPMEVLKEKDMPIPDAVQDLQLNVELWQGEYESAAINIINCTDKAMRLCVSVSPLTGPGGVDIDSKEVFTIRRGVFANAALVGLIADALVLQNERPFSLESGSVAQIWLTIFNQGLAAGNYRGNIAVAAVSEGERAPIETVPININVAQIKFPRTAALNSCVWAYPQAAAETKNSMAEVMQDLRSHHTNIFVAHSSDIPFPRERLASTQRVVKVDYSHIDRLIRMSNYARTYLFFFNFREQQRDWGRFGKWMTPAWKRFFSLWLSGWVEHLKKTGIGYDKFAMYPFDESLCDEFFELAKLIKSIDPEIRIYANSFGKGPADFMRFKDLIDIWCPRGADSLRYPGWLKSVKSFGKEVWTYNTRWPGKANEPYSYYRLMPWRAFKRGQRGAGFWTYVDYYKKGYWDDTGCPTGDSGVVYGFCMQSAIDTLGEDIVPSRRWEAWREGVEDYQYLYELQKAINSTKKSKPEAAGRAQKLLDSQVERVLKEPGDCSVVYQARRTITDEILRLLRVKN